MRSQRRGGPDRGGRGPRPAAWAPAARYPRVARVNRLLMEVVAEELERLADRDERLRLITVTAVESDPGLRHATVLMASLGEDAARGLDEARVRLQAAIAHQVRLKRTPRLYFVQDPAIAHGQHIEAVLADMARRRPPKAEGPAAGAPGREDPEREGP